MLDYSYLKRASWGKGCFIEDYILLTGIVAMLKPKTILEIGTSTGLGAVVLANAAKQWRKDCNVYTIDVSQKSGKNNLRLVPGIADYITFYEENTNSILPKWIKENRRFDLCFLDGDHSYRQANRDWNNLQYLTNTWVLHDTTQHQGLQRLVATIRENKAFDVFQFASAPGHRYKPDLTKEGFITGMTLVQKRSNLKILPRQAHRDDYGDLLNGHPEREVPKLPLLFP